MTDNWRDDAACIDSDPEAFYPNDQAGVDYALGICLSCDVMEECLADAVETGDGHARSYRVVRGGRLFGLPLKNAEVVEGEPDSDGTDVTSEAADGRIEAAPGSAGTLPEGLVTTQPLMCQEES